MTPFYDDGRAVLHVGHVLDVLAGLEAGSVQTVVTSPPYWGLRSYSTEPQWWGGDPDCQHAGKPMARRVLTGGTGSASAKQVTNRGSQFGNELMKADPLTDEMGGAVTVDQTSEAAATADVQVNAERSFLALQGGVETLSVEEQHQVVREETATGAKGCTPSLIDTSIPVKNAADEVPHERLTDDGETNGQALTGQEVPGSQTLDQRLTPEMPAIGTSAVRGLFDVDRGTGAQEVPHENGAAFVQTHEANRSRLADVAIREHQPEPIGEVGADSVEPIPQDCVSGLSAHEVSGMGSARTGDGAEGPQPFSVTVPTGTQECLAAPLADHRDASIGASDGAATTEPDAGRLDVEGLAASVADDSRHASILCEKCGAFKCELGSEPTPDCLAWARGQEPCSTCFVCHLVTVFRAVRRVLHDSGTCWINLGDSMSGSGKGPTGHNGIGDQGQRQGFVDQRSDVPGLGRKQLLMMPARVALALQADGWILRSDITWGKLAPMSESVRDRPTNATEHIFLLAKNERYFYDPEAVRTPPAESVVARAAYANGGTKLAANGDRHDGDKGQRTHFADYQGGANLRNLWVLGPEPYPAAHFATFVSEIPRRAILAGTSARGQCPACGAPWRRVVERESAPPEVFTGRAAPTDGFVHSGSGVDGEMRGHGGKLQAWRDEHPPQTTGWTPTCACDAGDAVPQVVLDCFAGSGTTLAVARWHQRRAVGIELNPEYARLIEQRLAQGVLL